MIDTRTKRRESRKRNGEKERLREGDERRGPSSEGRLIVSDRSEVVVYLPLVPPWRSRRARRGGVETKQKAAGSR